MREQLEVRTVTAGAKNRFILSLCFVVMSTASVAQLSVNQFIKSGESETEINILRDQIDYLQRRPYRLAPIQKLEFRTRSSQLNRDRQDYALRVNPANPWEIRNTNRYFKAYETSLSIEKDLLLKDALIGRYTMIIEMIYLIELKQLREEKRKFTDTQVAILEKQQGSSFFDSRDYLELKVDQVTCMVEAEESVTDLENKARSVAVKHNAESASTVNWDAENFITVDKVQRTADSLLRIELPSLNIAYKEQQIRLAMQEYKLEKSNISVGYVQTQYQHYRIDQGRLPWNVAVGVTIPIFNPNKGDMAKRQLEVIESQQELKEEKSERVARTKLIYEKLAGDIQRYREMEKKLSTLKTGTLSHTLRNFDSGNPILVVEFETQLIKLRTLMTKLRQSILLTYIDLLAYTDNLQKRPLINYLSQNLDEIQTP